MVKNNKDGYYFFKYQIPTMKLGNSQKGTRNSYSDHVWKWRGSLTIGRVNKVLNQCKSNIELLFK